MKTIWKYVLSGPVTILDLPSDAEILCVQMQNGLPTMWVLLDTSAHTIPRYFNIYPTGSRLPDSPGRYISTFQQHDGALVFHVYERN